MSESQTIKAVFQRIDLLEDKKYAEFDVIVDKAAVKALYLDVAKPKQDLIKKYKNTPEGKALYEGIWQTFLGVVALFVTEVLENLYDGSIFLSGPYVRYHPHTQFDIEHDLGVTLRFYTGPRVELPSFRIARRKTVEYLRAITRKEVDVTKEEVEGFLTYLTQQFPQAAEDTKEFTDRWAFNIGRLLGKTEIQNMEQLREHLKKDLIRQARSEELEKYLTEVIIQLMKQAGAHFSRAVLVPDIVAELSEIKEIIEEDEIDPEMFLSSNYGVDTMEEMANKLEEKYSRQRFIEYFFKLYKRQFEVLVDSINPADKLFFEYGNRWAKSLAGVLQESSIYISTKVKNIASLAKTIRLAQEHLGFYKELGWSISCGRFIDLSTPQFKLTQIAEIDKLVGNYKKYIEELNEWAEEFEA